MKKILVASVLASVGMAVSSYGQGFVNFASYNFGATSLDAPVTFATSGVDASSGNQAVTAGWGVGSSFTADLLFQFGTMTSYSLLTAGQANGTPYPTSFAFGLAGNGPVDNASTFAGYFFGPPVTIPGYASGAVSFIIEVYNGADYASSGTGTGIWRGQSAVINAASIATGTAQPTDLAFSGFTVSTTPSGVPEPSTLALAGLGGFGMLMAMRRKKA